MDDFEVWLGVVFDAVTRFASDHRNDDRQRLVERMESSVVDVSVLYRALRAGEHIEGAPLRPSDAVLLRHLEEAQGKPVLKAVRPVSDRIVPLPRPPRLEYIEEALDELSWLEGGLIRAQLWAQSFHRPSLQRHLAAAQLEVGHEVRRLRDELFDQIEVRVDKNSPTASILPFPTQPNRSQLEAPQPFTKESSCPSA